MSNQDLIIIGGGGFSLELVDFIFEEDIKTNITGFLDDSSSCPLSQSNFNIDHIGALKEKNIPIDCKLFIAIGDPIKRKEIYEHYKDIGPYSFYTFIHSSAHVSRNVEIGEGSYVGPHCVVSYDAKIEANVSINVFSGVGHGAYIGAHSVISPYSVLNGNCKAGICSMFGSNTILFQDVEVGNFCTIDAGSIIRTSLGDYKMLRNNEKSTIVEDILKKRLFE